MMDQLTTILDEDGADAIIPQVMRGLEPETVLRHPMAYRCACSRARVEQALRQCGVQELQDMIADGKNTQVHCQFCDAEYVFTRRSCRRCSMPKTLTPQRIDCVRGGAAAPKMYICRKNYRKSLDNFFGVLYNEQAAKREHSSAGRALALQARGHRFEPCCSHQFLNCIRLCSSVGRAGD